MCQAPHLDALAKEIAGGRIGLRASLAEPPTRNADGRIAVTARCVQDEPHVSRDALRNHREGILGRSACAPQKTRHSSSARKHKLSALTPPLWFLKT
jgi:hypothetical protein